MSLAFLFPFLCALVLLALVARRIVYPVHHHDIDHVIFLIRKLEVSDLEALLDVGEEWTLRRSLSPEAYRAAQEDRIRLVREYLRRVAHNVKIIQLWVAGEYELIKDKNRDSYTEKDSLVAEALQVAIELRVYMLGAGTKTLVLAGASDGSVAEAVSSTSSGFACAVWRESANKVSAIDGSSWTIESRLRQFVP